MNAKRRFFLPSLATMAVILSSALAQAETRPAQQKPGAASAPSQAKQKVPAAKPSQKPGSSESMAAAAALLPPSNLPKLIGQYDNWGAYWAAPEGRKICFIAARPNGTNSNRGRKPAYLFISSRPHEKVKDEISVVASSPFKLNTDATAAIGGKTYMMVTRIDGAWVKNAPDETRLIEAMRKGGELVLKGTTDRGLQSTDVYSTKGLAQALDRIARECK
jgi:hypothetical protein